jgi:radical SAM enzyme (TIGR01210 family)
LDTYYRITKDCNVELEIGMGFESSNDLVRNICVNKGEKIEDFKNAIELINERGFLSLAYVLLKPPFLTEQESIDDASASVHDAVSLGFDRISLEPMTIHKYTVVDALRYANQYSTPWLWSVLEVINNCRDVDNLGIGGIGYYPIPLYSSRNYCECEIIAEKVNGETLRAKECEKEIFGALKAFNMNHDHAVFDALDFDCKHVWKGRCRGSTAVHSLKDRINAQIECIDVDSYHDSSSASIGVQESPAQSFADSVYIARGSQTQHYSNGVS